MVDDQTQTDERASLLALALEANRVAQLEARLEAEHRQRKLAETLRAVSAALNASLELPEVLDRVLTSLAEVVAYDSASLVLREGELLHFVATHGHPENVPALGMRVPLTDDALFAEIVRTQRPIILVDAHADPRWDYYPGTEYIRGWLGVPMILRGAVIGMLALDSRQMNAYGETESDLALAFADQAVIAIQNARMFEEMRRLAITDGLTGIFNRRHFFSLAEHEFQRLRRYHHPLSALMIDVDHFKTLNDSYGHAAGDEVLRQIAQRCQNNVREVDLIARYGGEEFVVLLPNSDVAAARQAAERLMRCIADEPFPTAQGPLAVTISVGVATADETMPDVSALLNRADNALYRAKRQGRNRIEVAA
jgi:diguanylate cyclase (GGDEF)-like protein